MKYLSLVFLFLFSQVNAQDYRWTSDQSGPYTYKTIIGDPTEAKFYTLDNGLTVILSENKDKPRIQTIISTKAGSKTDPSSHTGLAHYLEHMLFKGTDKYGTLNWEKEKVLLDQIDELYEKYNSSKDEAQRKIIYKAIDSVSGLASKQAIANEYDKLMAMIGAKGTNAFTSFEETAYINDIPANQIDNWLKVEAERFRNPILRIFHTELEAVYEEKNRSLDDDGSKVFEALFANLFKNHNYGKQTTIGTIEHLRNPSLKEIRKYFYKNYVPNNMCLIMVGDFEAETLIEKIDRSFSYMKPKNVNPYTFKAEEPITSPIEKEILGPDAEYLMMAYRFPGAGSKEALMLDLMSSILSNGSAGLLDLNLVKQQKVRGAGGGAYVLKDYSILYLQANAKEGQKLEEVKELILNEIEKIKKGEFDEKLIQAIVNNVNKAEIQSNESNSGRAYTLLDAFIQEQDWMQNVRYAEELSALSKKDIQDFTSKWLGNNYVCIYKRSGKDPNALKVDKPQITPISVNRDAQSPFVQDVANSTVEEIEPVFFELENDIVQSVVKTPNAEIPLLYVQNEKNDLFTQYYYIEMGSHHMRLLPYAMNYLEYLGSSTKSAETISKLFYTLACDFGVSSNARESYVYLSGLQKNYTEALQLFEELLSDCIMDERALKEMIADEKKNRLDSKKNKGAIRSGLINWARYGADNPFNYELSNEELDAIRPEQLVEIIRSILNYKHEVLYYGPAELPELQSQLAKHHKVAKEFIPIPERKKFSYQKQDSKSVLLADYDMVQSEISWIRNNETYDTKLEPTVRMFNEYFGGNMSGIVFQDIRESKALAYSSYGSFRTPSRANEPMQMIAYIGCQSDKMKESITAMNALLNELPTSEKLFTNSQKSLLTNARTSRINKTSLLFKALSMRKLGLDYDMRSRILSEGSKMKFTDIKKFHENYIANKAYTLAVLGSKDKLDLSALKAYGPLQEISLEKLFGY